MHEVERHRLILSAVADQPVVTLVQLVEMTGASEATIRRDITALDQQNKLRKVRGGAEALHPPQQAHIAGRPFDVNKVVNIAQKTAIAKAAVDLCAEGESIIINGGTTTYEMTQYLVNRRMQILTNSFPIADVLVNQSKNMVTVPGGAIYREQQIILSPFENDVTGNFAASKMFMGAYAVGPLGVLEADPLLIQAERKLIDQAEQLIVMVDSSKFERRSSLILCRLDQVHTIITDEGISSATAKMIKQAGVRLVVAQAGADEKTKSHAI